MFLWFVGMGPTLVWAVLRDPAVDYRIVIAGTLVPDIIDWPRGGGRELHALVTSAVALAAVMLLTRGRRRARRRWLALPMGMFVHLLLDGAWARTDLLWWPFTGWSLAGEELPSLDHGPAIVVLEEIIGAAAVAWWWTRFRLHERHRRAAFLRTGRVGRDLAGPSSPR